ncbi:2138_t:CDS:2 [Funneliformis caledonium]|uniref:2138_t:CDS:1 n=1 Tax=Funneliformis caledonium TaxID=1117310 RepID=A0A9N9B9E9_9GLOM|nr:2138_t:CDS:2 [Funneliformis caledonium]
MHNKVHSERLKSAWEEQLEHPTSSDNMFQEIGAKNQILLITTTKHFIIRQEGTIEEVTPENILFGQVDKPVIQLPSPIEQRPTNIADKYLISDLRRKSMKTIWESLTDEKVIQVFFTSGIN